MRLQRPQEIEPVMHGGKLTIQTWLLFVHLISMAHIRQQKKQSLSSLTVLLMENPYPCMVTVKQAETGFMFRIQLVEYGLQETPPLARYTILRQVKITPWLSLPTLSEMYWMSKGIPFM